MEVFLIKALQMILALSLLVVLHEGGHFAFSKLFGVRVEKFYCFFDPWFHIISTKDKWVRKLFKRPMPEKDENGNEPYSGTEYGIGWIPLGGYVKIAGMIDESMDTEQMAQPEQPWEFRSKPAWQRLLIMVGGVLVNFVLALFIYSMVLYTWGDSYVPIQSYSQGMSFNERAKEIGFQDGDILLATEKGEITARKTGDIFRTIADAKTVTVKRGGQETTLTMPEDLNLLDMVNEVPQFMEMLIPNVVDSVVAGMPGDLAGLKAGDKLVAVNGATITNHNQFLNEMARINDQALEATAADSLKLRHVTLVVERGAACDTLQIQATPDFKIGFSPVLPEYETVQLDYGFLEAIPAGISYGWNVLSGYVGDMKYVFTKKGAKSVGGFATIGSIFPAAWDWHAFWNMTALLSIILAFMNILPIPALDGGHVLFLLWEVITRRKPNDKFMEYAQMVGMGILFLLMIWANLNDVIRFLF